MRANKRALHSKASHFSRMSRSRSRYTPDGRHVRQVARIEDLLLASASHPVQDVSDQHPTPDAMPLPPPLRLAEGKPVSRWRIDWKAVATAVGIALAITALLVLIRFLVK